MSADRWATWEINAEFELVEFDRWKHDPDADEITYESVLFCVYIYIYIYRYVYVYIYIYV